MPAKKPKKPQPQQPEQPKQTLLSILPQKVVEPLAEPPTQPAQETVVESVKVEEPLAEPPTQPTQENVVEQVLVAEPPPQSTQENVVEQVLADVPVTDKPKPVKRILPPPTRTEAEKQSPTPTDSEKETPTPTDPEPRNNAFFQAVGIIVGFVKFDEEGKGTVTIGQKEYQLFYASKHRYAYEALKKELKATGGDKMRLIVYPRVMHFPKREQPYLMSFQLVGFNNKRTEPTGVAKELQDFEFKLCGLWQFIPVCQTPCISVFKNFNKERLEYIKSAEADKKVRFMKASHVPLNWRDAPVRPFRFNPKLDKEQQGHSSFVEVLAKFLPERDVFGFSKLLSEPMEKAPNFLKARKEDKAEALKNKLAKNKQKDIAKKSVWSKPKKKD